MPVPAGAITGLATVIVTRPQYVFVSQPGVEPVLKKELIVSNDAFLGAADSPYVFAALGSTNHVAVINTIPGDNGVPANSLVARIALSPNANDNDPTNDPFLSPRAVAVTDDGTRAYVTLRGGHAVAVIDTISLQEVDTIPGNAGPDGVDPVDPIALPDSAVPFGIVVDSKHQVAYVSDEVSGQIYVIDIDPQSDAFDRHIETITVDPAPVGLRGMALDSAGRTLYVAAPGRTLFGGVSAGPPPTGHILAVDVNPESSTFEQTIGAIPAGLEPYGVTTTVIRNPATQQDDQYIAFTNRLDDVQGLGVIKATGPTSWEAPRFVNLTLGSTNDSFDVNNAEGVTFTADLRYAFVAGYDQFIQGNPSHDPDMDPLHPAGGNIGVIVDPFGISGTPKLLAGTIPVPYGFPDNLVLSSDGHYLYTGFRGNGTVLVYDAQKIIQELSSADAPKLPTTPLDALQASVLVATIATGSAPQGLAVQPDFVRLVAPLTSVPGAQPDFQWKVNVDPSFITSDVIYVSTFGPGQGLFPSDLPPPTPPDGYLSSHDPSWFTSYFNWLKFSGDLNLHRIVNGESGTLNRDSAGNPIVAGLPTDALIYQLPDTRMLTAGQTYYWGVEVVTADGRHSRKSGQFQTDPMEARQPDGSLDTSRFSTVTVVTHGFQLHLPMGAGPYNQPAPFVELAENISNVGGDGTVLLYNRVTGGWGDTNHDDVTNLAGAIKAGKPLVLVMDWKQESDITDSGFAEAAGDAFFAALVKLDQQLSGMVFRSPLHFIGHSRGTVVNSEVIQRLGTYFPQVTNIQMTTLDPHDFQQDSLDVPLEKILEIVGRLGALVLGGAEEGAAAAAAEESGLAGLLKEALSFKNLVTAFAVPDFKIHFGDFFDPNVQVWDNIAFADNYYQTQASPTNLTATPNGRAIPGADLNLALDGLAGFTQDDIKSPLLNLVLDSDTFGIGGPHSRVWRWYAGTTNLGLTTFETGGEPIFRTLGDGVDFTTSFLPIYSPFTDFNWNNPWYVPVSDPNPSQATWEGIGTGWYFADIGGGADQRPAGGDRQSVFVDNTEGVPAAQLGSAVPSVFNGNFELGDQHTIRFPISLEAPGWSFQGGQGYTLDFGAFGKLDITQALIFQTDPKAEAGTVLQTVVNQALEGTVSTLEDLVTKATDHLLPADWQASAEKFIEKATERLGAPLDSIKEGIASHMEKLLEDMSLGSNHALLMGGQGALKNLLSAPEAVFGQDSTLAGLLQAGLTQDQKNALLDSLVNLNQVTHDRMYVPKSSVLSFDVLAPILLAPNSRINVLMNDGSGQVQIGSVDLDPAFFQTLHYSINVPTQFQDTVVTITFEVQNLDGDVSFLNDASALLSQFFFLDNIRLAPSLTPPLMAISDTSGDPQDGAAFFTAEASNTTHTVTVKNVTNQPIIVTAELVGSAFIKQAAFGGAVSNLPLMDNLNDQHGHTFFVDRTLNPGEEATITFTAALPADYYAGISADQDEQVLSTRLMIRAHTADNHDQASDVQLFDFVDAADAKKDDAQIELADTLTGTTRTVKIANSDQLRFEVSQDAGSLDAGTFSELTGAGDVAAGIKFVASNGITQADGLAALGELKILTHDGRELGTIELKARTMPKQTVDDPLPGVVSQLQHLRDELSPGLPFLKVQDVDGWNANKYTTFMALFPDPSDPLAVDKLTTFESGFSFAVQQVYGPFYGDQLQFAQNGLNPIVLENSPYDPSISNNVEGVSRAQLDFAYTTFETLLTATDLSPASRRFQLDRLINTRRDGGINGGPVHLVIDEMLREANGSGFAGLDQHTYLLRLGQAFGWVVAHELGHQFGLFDEYLYGNPPISAALTAINFMSDFNRTATTPQQRLALGLALDDPQQEIATDQIQVLFDWYKTLNNFDKINHPNRAPASVNPAPTGSSASPGQMDPGGILQSPIAEIPQAVVASTLGVPTGIVNGNFSIQDTADPHFGWTSRGAASVVNGQAVLSEDSRVFTGFSQTFVVPDGVHTLSFSIVNAALGASGDGPPDAFEVALLDATSLASPLGTTAGLANTDALLNIQRDGKVFFGSQVTVPGVTASGQTAVFNSPVTVTIDLTGVAPGTAVTLYFDLLGFGALDSTMVIDDVRFDVGVPPVAGNDAATTNRNTPVPVNVLGNDTDSDGTVDPTTVLIVSGASHGTTSVDPTTGVITYTPALNYTGSDSFTYTVKDNTGADSNEATVSITVNTPPVAGNDAATTNRNTPVPVNVLGNDTDSDGTVDPTSVAIVLAASHGTTSVDPTTGVITYTPALNYTGPDSFTYTVKDNLGAESNQATVSISVTGPLIGLLLLDPRGKGALTDDGNGSVVVNNGSIVVDSSSDQAAIITGNGNVNAAIIDVTGGTRTTGHGQFVGSIVHAAPTPDPLGLPLPPAPSTKFAAVNYSGSAPLTLNPGTYVGGISISGQGSVTLKPGIYYMQGGGFSVTGRGSVTGNGVLIINAGGKSDDRDDEDDGHDRHIDHEARCGADKEASTGNISFSGQGSVSLTAPATLPNAYKQYAGIAIFQNPTSNSAINFSGRGSLTIQGVVYAPKATLNISGQGNMVVNPGPASNMPAEVIVYDAHVTGNGGLTINNIQPLFPVSVLVTNNNNATSNGTRSASSLPATSAGSSSSIANVPDWLTNPPPNADLNSGPRATYFRQLAAENTRADRAVLVEADRIADALGLDDELLDSLLAGLGLK